MTPHRWVTLHDAYPACAIERCQRCGVERDLDGGFAYGKSKGHDVVGDCQIADDCDLYIVKSVLDL